jgi:Glycerate kinase family
MPAPSIPAAEGGRALPGVPATPLIATGPFGGLPAERVAALIARGLRHAGRPAADLLPLAREGESPAELRELLDGHHLDARVRAARAVILGRWRLQERTLAGSVFFEIATRARQAGVPAYAVAGRNRLDSFDARILDLQLLIEASSERALVAAGRTLANVI